MCLSHIHLKLYIFNFARNALPATPVHFRGRFFLQVQRPQGVPVLALAGNSGLVKRMQNHVPYAWLFYGKTAGFAGIFDRTTARPVLHGGGFNSGSVQA
jgi:hypothetical protein